VYPNLFKRKIIPILMQEQIKKKYLITGITGFTGPHLANELFSSGYDVAGLVRTPGSEKDILDTVSRENFDKITFFYGDIIDQDYMNKLFSENKFDGVFHLAALSHPPTSFKKPRECFLVNALGTVNIVDAIEKHQPSCKLMYCSTPEVYGIVQPKDCPILEDSPLRPPSPYSRSKEVADNYVRDRAKFNKNLNFFVTRAFSNTGPRRPKNFSIASDAHQIARILEGKQEKIINVGTLSSKRPVMDVRDCVRGYNLLMQNFVSGEIYNFGGDILYSIGELLDKMIEISGLSEVKKVVDPNLVRKIDIPIQYTDSTKMINQTGWKQQIPIVKTLTDLLDYHILEVKNER